MATWTWTVAAAVVVTIAFGTVYWTTSYSDLDIGSITLALYVVAALPVVALRATGVAPVSWSALLCRPSA